MGLRRRRWRGSGGWWAVLLCAFLALGVYIVFEALDVDGSDLRDWLSGNAIAAQSTRAETKRPFYQASATPWASELVSLSLTLRFIAKSTQVTSRIPPAVFAGRPGQIRPRARVSRETPCATSPIGEPA